jgi:hypothetical protein
VCVCVCVGPWGFDGEPRGKDGVTPPLADIGV